MAKKKHRKLFPMLSSEPNKTLDCSIGICDQICPYNCYQEPRYYATSPLQPPWSSPQSITAPSPSVSAVNEEPQKPSSSFDAITIIAVTGAALFILLTGFFLVAKFVSDSVNRERYQSQRDDNDSVEEEFQDREHVEHPIWLIRTTGLQQSIINSITICNYKRGDGLIERTDCPVCLSEFEEDESLRLLPKCNHAFHISCIDTWLKSHTNCPLCRAGIAISATPRCSGPVNVAPGGSGSRSENDLDRAQIENRAESGRLRDSDNTDQNSDRVLGNCIDLNGEDSINSPSHSKTHMEKVNFAGKSCVNQSQDFNRQENRPIGDEASCSEENGGHNVQPWRSSDSIGSGESNDEVSEGTTDSGISSNTLKTIENSSVSCFNKNKTSIFPLS